MQSSEAPILVIGGGIAGLAAAVRLAEAGQPVTLFERRPLLGGRASSFPLATPLPGDESAGEEDSPEGVTRQYVDNCQHVLMRCCVNLLDFYTRISAGDAVEFYKEFQFVDREGRWSSLAGSRWLPAPLHLLPSLLRFQTMSPADRTAILYAMARLSWLRPADLEDYQTTFSDWLKRMRQTRGAIECFWRPVVVSALNEEPERTAAAYAFQLFRKAFLRSSTAFEMGLPRIGLADIYSTLGIKRLSEMGAQVLTECSVDRIIIENGRAVGVQTAASRVLAPVVVSAVAHSALPALLDEEIAGRPPFSLLYGLGASPITGIHLWFDRPVADRPHVALLGREMQWIFTKDRDGQLPQPGDSHASHSSTSHQRGTFGSYLGLVVSASRPLTPLSRGEIIALALDAVHAVYPASREAKVLHNAVIREPRATFSPAPGAESLRPHQRTDIPGLYLAGDWTRTGWPATMEGAVRSGYLAAEAILNDRGVSGGLLCPEMPADFIPSLLKI